ncbi:MAG: bi-domain-containing oxidoreductase [Acidimicrobiales bacterium]
MPAPVIGPTEVLVRTMVSTVSPGTERAVTELAQSSLLAKARARPDLVRQVVRKARTEGVRTAARAVRARLGDDVPLGYSAAGVVLEVGPAVAGVRPGQLVATGGAGKANHAELQAVAGLLSVPVPDGVVAADAAMATIGAIALHGLRLAGVGPGSKVVVVGLGLVGQLALRLARAAGSDGAGIDVAPFPLDRAKAAGALALAEEGEATTAAVRDWSRGRGADAVVVAAASSSSEVMARVPGLCRDGATVVVVGDVGLDLDRRPFYENELTVRFARSYGPGRYDRSYEEWGVDYPAGQVRWTEGRNLEAVLDLIAAGHLKVDDLVTHRFGVDEAPAAYHLVQGRTEPVLGIQLTYPGEAGRPRAAPPARPARIGATPGAPGIGLLGAGAFATGVLVPALRSAGLDRLVAVGSASGLSARRLADRAGFLRVAAPGDVVDDPEVHVVVVATPHDTHAGLVVRALEAGKHVFCEKPLALSVEELEQVESAWREAGRVLWVGFNRRWSRPVADVRAHVGGGTGPLVVDYRVSAGTLPASHWYGDRRQGGRLLGEVCHFVDTCAAIVGSTATGAHAAGSGGGELLLSDDAVVLLAYPDGSLATIAYASGGHPGTEKERIEVLGRGHTATVVDFREVVLDGKSTRLGHQDKGHVAEVAAFARAVRGWARPDEVPTEAFLASSATTLAAAASLSSGTSPGDP